MAVWSDLSRALDQLAAAAWEEIHEASTAEVARAQSAVQVALAIRGLSDALVRAGLREPGTNRLCEGTEAELAVTGLYWLAGFPREHRSASRRAAQAFVNAHPDDALAALRAAIAEDDAARAIAERLTVVEGG